MQYGVTKARHTRQDATGLRQLFESLKSLSLSVCVHSPDATLLSKTVFTQFFLVVEYQTCVIVKTSCRGHIVADESCCDEYAGIPSSATGFLPLEMFFVRSLTIVMGLSVKK